MGAMLILPMIKSHIYFSLPRHCFSMNSWWSLPLKPYHAKYLPNAILFFLLVSNSKGPAFEYRDWLAKMSGKYDVDAYMLMYK